jgi:hypothetical protein
MKTIEKHIIKNPICFTEAQEQEIAELKANGFKLAHIRNLKGSDSRKFTFTKVA